MTRICTYKRLDNYVVGFCSGRLDKLLYVPLPTPDDRVSILKALSANIKLSPDVDLNEIGRSQRSDGYSGADCAALLREAGLSVLKQTVGDADPGLLSITPRHFDYAFDHVVPSVSKKDQARYNRMRDRIAHARSRGAVVSEATIGLDEANEEPLDEHIEETIEATTTNGVIMAGDASQLSNVSDALEETKATDLNGTKGDGISPETMMEDL